MTSTSISAGLVVAMEAELIHTLRAFSPEQSTTDDGWTFHHLSIDGRAVVAMCCGMGLINAAAGTERLVASYHPGIILNYGCSGAHRPEIMPGDVIVGSEVVHHSAMQILKDGSERYAGFGYEVAGEKMNAARLASDPALLAIAADAVSTAEIEDWPEALFWPRATPRRGATVHTGVVASADIWTQATERLDVLHDRHQSLCEDMEAAAIAQIAARHGARYLTIKDISNNEYHQASDLDGFTDFPVAEIGKRAAALMIEVIRRLPA